MLIALSLSKPEAGGAVGAWGDTVVCVSKESPLAGFFGLGLGSSWAVGLVPPPAVQATNPASVATSPTAMKRPDPDTAFPRCDVMESSPLDGLGVYHRPPPRCKSMSLSGSSESTCPHGRRVPGCPGT